MGGCLGGGMGIEKGSWWMKVKVYWIICIRSSLPYRNMNMGLKHWASLKNIQFGFVSCMSTYSYPKNSAACFWSCCFILNLYCLSCFLVPFWLTTKTYKGSCCLSNTSWLLGDRINIKLGNYVLNQGTYRQTRKACFLSIFSWTYFIVCGFYILQIILLVYYEWISLIFFFIWPIFSYCKPIYKVIK